MSGVIYARYSSDAQREESIDAQIRENKVFAERHSIEIVGTYIDRALSAKTDNRPEFQRMIKDSAKKALKLLSYGSWIDSRAIGLMQQTTKTSFGKMESNCCLPRRTFLKAQRASCSNLLSKALRSISQRN